MKLQNYLLCDVMHINIFIYSFIYHYHHLFQYSHVKMNLGGEYLRGMARITNKVMQGSRVCTQ